ncbi:carbohydrate esterase family 16 protein [Sphaerobolus stellatus SS14]|uniref:Carbohydrate esterase family 16 protein n=1 Tax=Sphaerobolus stellatus (strain SS14) TaxID=990650 RepID=A0A0C9W517_SPHS4|nr:carbohydrate esterase family 16 protein [Sphaerobolus stellatus SS14]
MTELVSGNKLAELIFQALASTLKGAHIGEHTLVGLAFLFVDMFTHPQLYLNGTAPFNVTGAVNSCVFDLNSNNNKCTVVQGAARDSFL